ncbi:MAG: alpha/beta hydrolase [Eubacterium sp.]|nr:alpha/beta hydrolase [Eubacterium sp.]
MSEQTELTITNSEADTLCPSENTDMKKNKKGSGKAAKIIGISALCAAAAAGAFAGGSVYFFKMIVPRETTVPLPFKEDAASAELRRKREGKAREWIRANGGKDIFTRSHDGLQLRAQLIPAAEESDKYVILMHGYRGSAEHDFGPMLPFYHEQGFNILLPDLRAHGQSEGKYVGLGYTDHDDLLKWIDYLTFRHNDCSIYLHGLSAGAAAVMMASGELLPSQVKGAIADSGFSTLTEELHYCFAHFLHVRAHAMVRAISAITKKKAGYSFADSDCLKALAKTSLPLLFIHGGADTLVPPYMADKCYNACASEDKDMLFIEGAPHIESYSTEPAAYEKALKEFFERTSQ